MPSLITSYLGVDPGKNGGLALVSVGGRLIWAIKMPQTERDLFCCLRDELNTLHTRALIEKPNLGHPMTSKHSMAKLYGNYCSIRMALIGNKIPFEEITPAKWVRGVGIPARGKSMSKTDWKNTLKQKAQQMFPKAKVTLAVADAILIAVYARRYYGAVPRSLE